MAQSMLPARVAECLGHGVSEQLAERLLASDRLAGKLQAFLERKLGHMPILDAEQGHVLNLDNQGLAILSRQAGAVWHGDIIAGLVDGPSVRALVAAIGKDLWLLAVRGRALAQPALAQPAAAITPELIAAALPEIGLGCLIDWCDAQPSPIAGRLALRLPYSGPRPSSQTGGAAIVSWLLEGVA